MLQFKNIFSYLQLCCFPLARRFCQPEQMDRNLLSSGFFWLIFSLQQRTNTWLQKTRSNQMVAKTKLQIKFSLKSKSGLYRHRPHEFLYNKCCCFSVIWRKTCWLPWVCNTTFGSYATCSSLTCADQIKLAKEHCRY